MQKKESLQANIFKAFINFLIPVFMGTQIDARKEMATENYRKDYKQYCHLFSDYMVSITSLE